jgi:hypothetical protein
VADVLSGPSLDSTPYYANFKKILILLRLCNVYLTSFRLLFKLNPFAFVLFLHRPQLFPLYLHMLSPPPTLRVLIFVS